MKLRVLREEAFIVATSLVFSLAGCVSFFGVSMSSMKEELEHFPVRSYMS